MRRALLIAACFAGAWTAAHADNNYVEPGSLRLSSDLTLEGLFHRVNPPFQVNESGLTKSYDVDNDASRPWKTEWGQTLLTEAAARFTPDVFARVLFEAQGQYADRYWRPINIEHYMDQEHHPVLVKELEARIDRSEWFAHGFSGVGHGNWADKGDFFGLYPESRPDDDYLGQSGLFGVYPDRYKQNLFMNESQRRVPQGMEAGAHFLGLDAGFAFGDELQWGYNHSGYGRLTAPLGKTQATFVYKDEDVPFTFDTDRNERNRAAALSWAVPSEAGHRLDVGVLYNPFRVDRPYLVADKVAAGEGIGGSSTRISQKTSQTSDAFAYRLRVIRFLNQSRHEVQTTLDLTHAGILAGNRNQVDARLATNIVPTLRGSFLYTYRKPIDGPLPFIYEGTPDNIGAVLSSPRGPESPFTVNWTNREAVFLVTTLVYDPTPGTTFLLYDQDTLQAWNINPDENAPFALAVQWKMSDYRTTIDRQYYYNQSGDIVWETAAHNGAWASDGFLHEVRALARGAGPVSWTLGVAAGESPALSGLAFTTDDRTNKPLSDYFDFESTLTRDALTLWGHYGNGLWGPEPYQRFFGESFDHLWGVGVSYKITPNTLVDVSYLAARQDDRQFLAPDLGDYDEIRTLFTHRFGFLFQFQEARAGTRAR